MKHLLCFLVLMCVSLSAMASNTSVKNAEGVEIWYNFNSSTKTASVTYRGSNYLSNKNEYTGEVVIPSTVTYKGVEYSVTSIGENAFCVCSSLTSITLPEGLTSIGNSAFNGCEALTSITLPESLTEIGARAFYDCKALTSITIPDGVTSIGNSAFNGCEALTSITLPEGLTSIGDVAFVECSALTSITLPESLTSIGYEAFHYCYKLYEVYNKSDLTITAGSTDKGYVAFYAKNVYTDSEGESKLKTVGDYIFYVDGEDIELIAYTGSETSITLPSDYEGKNYNIGDYAFYKCSALTSVTIPEGVTSIGDDAFAFCYRLYEVYNKSDLTITAGDWYNGRVAFYAKNVYSDGESKLKTVGDYIFYVDSEDIELIAYTGGETSITLPSDYEGKNYNIGDYAFYECFALTSITLPEGITSIGDYAFEDSNSLTSITIPEGVTSIGNSAFGYCDALTSITLPESLTSIGNYAFYYCSALTSIISKNATPPTIGGSYTFYDVDKSIPVYVPKSSVDAYKSAEYWKDFTNIVGAYFVDVTAENGTVEGAGAYEENAEATLTATPAEGYKFVQWSDGVTDNPRTITITKDVSLEAIFEKDTSTAIENENVDAVSVRLIGNNIVVEGADDYTVYTISGQNLGKVESVERGIYIVVVNGKSFKVVAK